MDTWIVVPNWNGEDFIADCLESLNRQTQKHTVVVVDNGSRDDSVGIISKRFPEVELIRLGRNYGFAGGVNAGISHSLKHNADCIALLNNDAVVDEQWLEYLASIMQQSENIGIATSKILSLDGKRIDSTGDAYSIWGTPFPRGRNESDAGEYNTQQEVFAASGGASMYRSALFNDIGLFDEWFFAYYEDVDLSFRARLAGWEIRYQPQAIARHHVGATSMKIPNFTLYHQTKNFLPLFMKNMPGRFFWLYGWRVAGVFGVKMLQLLRKGKVGVFLKVTGSLLLHTPGVFAQRWRIQRHRTASSEYINDLLHHAPPPTQPWLVKLVKKIGIT